MSKHIPGPWRVVAQPHDGFTVERGDGKSICVIEEVYDAHLVSAAPDLLEALRGAALLIQNQLSPEGRQSVIQKMDAAVAKAEGRK